MTAGRMVSIRLGPESGPIMLDDWPELADVIANGWRPNSPGAYDTHTREQSLQKLPNSCNVGIEQTAIRD